MRILTLHLAAKTDEDLELSLEAIVDQIRDGYDAGIALSGAWQITGIEEPGEEDDE